MGDGKGALKTTRFYKQRIDTTQQMVIVYAFSQLGACSPNIVQNDTRLHHAY